MAFVRFIDGRTTVLPAEKALAVWEVLNGRREPENDRQAMFCSRVQRLYLNRNNAPQDYLDMYPQVPESYKSVLGIRSKV